MQTFAHFGGVGGHHVTDRAWASANLVSSAGSQALDFMCCRYGANSSHQPPPGANAPPLLNQGGELQPEPRTGALACTKEGSLSLNQGGELLTVRNADGGHDVYENAGT